MTIEALLARLHDLDVKLYAEGDRLRLSAPKGVLTSALQNELVERKYEIIDHLRQAGTVASPSAPQLRPIAREGHLPLSFAQERLWFLDQLTPWIPAYNIPFGLRFVGELDVAALEKSLNEIVRRHESLRTTFKTIDGQPSQTISDPELITLRVVDLRNRPAAEREMETRQIAEGDARQPFDLEKGPLIRTSLLRLGDHEYVLLSPMHHIVSDGWSLEVFQRELAALYRAFSRGQPSPLPELAIQYADFAQWQRDWLTGKVLETQLAYWRKQLAPGKTGSLPIMALPTDHPRPDSQTFRGATQSFTLSRELSRGLEALSRREESTLFMTLLAAFQALLFRYSGQEDILVGSPIANRNRTEIEGLIGFFANTLVLRTDLSGDPIFLDLLGRVRKVALEAYAHQDIPFEKLVEELQPGRDLSRPAFFQVMFVLLNMPSKPLELPGLSIRPIELDNATSKFDLTLFITNEHGILKGLLEYNTDLFEETTIRRMIGHFSTFLEGIASDPRMRISNLPLLTAPERRQLAVWNDTKAEYPREKCVHQLVEEQVERTPDAVALVFGETQLTFAQLDARANQLAHYLRTLGVEPDTRVGICVERSVEMAVGLLGILKAGGAYVPLDPVYPAGRLAFMLEDAQTPVLLTQQRLLEVLPEHNARTVCLDTDWSGIAQESEAKPKSTTTLDNLAYVIYTSGSTGRPKGVAMSHRPLSNLLWWQLKNFSLAHKAWTLQFTSPSFDVSFQEIFSTWCSGGTLILITEELRRDFAGMLRLIVDEKVERIFLPFVALQQLAEAAESSGVFPSGLVEIITAGEQLQISPQIARFCGKIDDCVLHNQYGPTESHVATSFMLRGNPGSWEPLPPIGRPIANTEIHILDQHLQPVPIGVPGELHIGGTGLARGYLNHPELTAEKFGANPFSGEFGARLYRTGDLARYRQDGDIEFLGRIDHQVKLRGYRVELGEIEAALRGHPAIREAVVEAKEEPGIGKRLVAYVVPSTPDAFSPGELRNVLKQQLPEYMVPAVFVTLDSLPLTPSGKVNRRALPAPDQAQGISAKSLIAPKDLLQIQLIKIWERILRVRPIGVRDNFFDLGGHSLLALRLFAEIEKRLGKKLPVAALFQAPTVEQLAEVIRKTGNLPQWSTLVPIQPEGSKLPIFCIHAGDGHPLRYPALAQHLGPEQPLFALQSPGMNGEGPLHHSIEEMASHYIQEIQEVQPVGPYMLAGLSMGGYVAFEMAQQLYAQGKQVGLLALFDTAIGNVQGLSRNERLEYYARKWETRFEFHLTRLVTLPPRQKLNHVWKWIKRRIEGDVDQEIAARRLAETISSLPPQLQEVWKANVLAMKQYVPKQYPGPVVLFKSDEGAGIYYGWQQLSKGGVQVHHVPGSHTGILEEPHVQVLAACLRTCLDKAQATAHHNPQ